MSGTDRKFTLVAARVLTVLAFAGAIVVACAHVAPRADGCLVPTAVAHRGGFIDSDHTENSIEAYRAMAPYGILAWEGDFRFSAGGGAYLMHDATIDRTTNRTGPADKVAIDSTTVRLDDGQELRLQKLSRLLPVGPVLNIKYSVLTPSLIAQYRNAGLRVDAWTVDSADGWTQTTSLSVDRVVSNRVGAYRGWRDARCTGTRWTS